MSAYWCLTVNQLVEMTLKDDKLRVKTSREELGKFFYRLAEISFTTMVMGGTISWLTTVSFAGVVCGGMLTTIFFALLGYRVMNQKIII